MTATDTRQDLHHRPDRSHERGITSSSPGNLRPHNGVRSPRDASPWSNRCRSIVTRVDDLTVWPPGSGTDRRPAGRRQAAEIA
ncbi:hypothetical protein EYF80_063251 [Liparis tanakae]|uniref:Uncharacterized protein n=1 Tax=Liparis tanakae TaxID=230148 RepID=A0A4Z2ED17_9TELE|nr:hypothetical protein EYF80_063251 [Liparis tanakae]